MTRDLPLQIPCAPFTGSQGDAGHTRGAPWHAGLWGPMSLRIPISYHPAYIRNQSSTALFRKFRYGMSIPGFSGGIPRCPVISSPRRIMQHPKSLPVEALVLHDEAEAPVHILPRGAQNEPRSCSLRNLHPSTAVMPPGCIQGF